MQIYPVEFWKELTYPGSIISPYYLISSSGRIYSKRLNHIMSDSDDGGGYRIISFVLADCGRKSFKIHRLVLMSFNYINGCEQLQVNHIHGDPYNNQLYNLEWVTGLENIQKGCELGLFPVGQDKYNAVLTNKQAHIICQGLQDGLSYEDIISNVGQTDYKNLRTLISGILNRKCWTIISSLYKFADYDTSHRKFSTDEVIKICKGLEKNLDYKQILISLGYDISTIEKDVLKTYSKTISFIRNGKIYTEISNGRIFPKQRSSQVFTDNQINEICKYLEQGSSYNDILTILGICVSTMSYNDVFNFKSILSAIKNRARFTKISKDYKF